MRVCLVLLLLASLACSTSSMIVPMPSNLSPVTAMLKQISDPVTPQMAVPAAGPELLVVCSDALNVRGRPSAEAAILATLPRGQRLRVYLWSDGWAYLGYGRWVNGDYLCH